ncbi:hypothetical protein [Clostridium sp. HBUAS56017]|uniref:hypothetical protein n=1 Tax=Clostridium sp. HBUAS56017 TaxID=2571128 RepID=UPI001178B9FD|nr:hypothetical protein [Clostridium sp. HBUAS56017]
MLTDVKAWIKATGMEVAENCFIKPPSLPYVIFTEEIKVRGADNKNCIADRSVSAELYSDRINHEAEEKVENLLNEKSIEYKKNRTWIDSEKFFQTVYDFDFIEKL